MRCLMLPSARLHSQSQGTVMVMISKPVFCWSVLAHFENPNETLTLKAPNKNCSRRHFNFFLLSLEENKA